MKLNVASANYVPVLWPENKTSSRVFSAIVACTVTVLFFSELNRNIHTQFPISTGLENAMVLTWIVSTPKPVPTPATVPILHSETRKNQSTSSPTLIKTTAVKRDVTTTTTQTTLTTHVNKSESNATNPTPSKSENRPSFDSIAQTDGVLSADTQIKSKFDSKAIRSAYESSKTDIQKMAEASGKQINDTRLSEADKFQNAAKNAVKPDCLRQGGSILSLFVIAYQAATDHCK